MKALLILATVLTMGNFSYAQTMGVSPLKSSTGTKHMFDFNADSVLRGVLSFGKSKLPGEDSDSDIQMDVRLNYAYQLDSMPQLQLGTRLDYLKDTASAGDIENWGIQIGGIWNQSTDLLNTMYASLYLGMLWNKEYGPGVGENDEVLYSTLALGRRYSMEKWGVKHLTYTPEIAFQNRNSTNGGDFSYTQSLELRFLQFSVFF